jgi:hypothetical protein
MFVNLFTFNYLIYRIFHNFLFELSSEIEFYGNNEIQNFTIE